jgi:hypothetical protein
LRLATSRAVYVITGTPSPSSPGPIPNPYGD